MEDIKIKAIAVDDEQHCIEVLEFELKRHAPEIQIQATFNDGISCKKYLTDNPVDLVFMDINLQTENGIELLESMLPVDFEVIFVTAYDEYAIKAFEVSAAHYLLKPIKGAKLKEAISRVKQSIDAKRMSSNLKHFIEVFRNDLNHANKIALSVQDGIEFIDPQEIRYIEGDNNYCSLFLHDDSKIVLSKTLKHMEENVLPSGFLRIHKSYIINLRFLKKYLKTDGGIAVLDNNKQLPVSRLRKHLLNSLFRD